MHNQKGIKEAEFIELLHKKSWEEITLEGQGFEIICIFDNKADIDIDTDIDTNTDIDIEINNFVLTISDVHRVKWQPIVRDARQETICRHAMTRLPDPYF